MVLDVFNILLKLFNFDFNFFKKKVLNLFESRVKRELFFFVIGKIGVGKFCFVNVFVGELGVVKEGCERSKGCIDKVELYIVLKNDVKVCVWDFLGF